MALFGHGTWTGAHAEALQFAYRMSNPQFAAKLGVTERTVINWKNAGSASKIRRVNQAALDTLLASAPPAVAQRFHDHIGRPRKDDDMNVDRRHLFASAGAIAALAATTDPVAHAAIENPTAVGKEVGAMGTEGAELVGRLLHDAMRLDDAMGGGAAQGIVAEVARLTANKTELLGLHAESLGFLGTIAWDQGDPILAETLYTKAQKLAHDADDADLVAYMLCHQAQLQTWEGRPKLGVGNACAAQAMAHDTRDIPLRGYASLRAAQAYARSGQRDPALRALDAAERDLPKMWLGPEDSRAYFFSAGLYLSYRGECLALIDNADSAAKAAADAADHFAPGMNRDVALARLNVYKGNARAGRVDEAAAAVSDAAKLARKATSERLNSAVLAARKELSPWAGSDPVNELDGVLDDCGIVGA